MDLVLLHGFAATAFTWREVLAPLREHHRVLTLDRRWAEPEVMLAQTLRDLDAADVPRPVLVGHSAGAELAVRVALVRPVRALVLLGPVVGGGPPPLARLLAGAPLVRDVAPHLLRLALRGLGPALRRAWHDPAGVSPAVVEGYRRPLLQPGVAEALWDMTRSHRDDGLLARVPQVGVPTLVLTGRSDRWATALPIPKAQSVEIERCGHLPQEEQPAATVDHILDFLGGLPADA